MFTARPLPVSTRFDIEWPLSMVTRGEGVFLGVSYAKSQGCWPQRSPIFWVPSSFIYSYTLWHRTTKFGMVKHMGRACFRRSPTPSIPRVWPQRSKALGVLYLYRYGLTSSHSARFTHMGEVHVLGGHPRHCVLLGLPYLLNWKWGHLVIHKYKKLRCRWVDKLRDAFVQMQWHGWS